MPFICAGSARLTQNVRHRIANVNQIADVCALASPVGV
jgi:hypothetical protein